MVRFLLRALGLLFIAAALLAVVLDAARSIAASAVTLTSVVVYSAYTVSQLSTLERLQTATIDRDRVDSLLLLRIQNNLNSIALTLRDITDALGSRLHGLRPTSQQSRVAIGSDDVLRGTLDRRW